MSNIYVEDLILKIDLDLNLEIWL